MPTNDYTISNKIDASSNGTSLEVYDDGGNEKKSILNGMEEDGDDKRIGKYGKKK